MISSRFETEVQHCFASQCFKGGLGIGHLIEKSLSVGEWGEAVILRLIAFAAYDHEDNRIFVREKKKTSECHHSRAATGPSGAGKIK